MSRVAASFAVALAGFAAFAPAPARADSGPVIVIPSRPGIPVVINGRDASYAVVEGDWGLSRPGAVPVTVIGGSPLLPNSVYTRRNSYHPKYGRAPRARPQRGRARGRSRAARSGGKLLALLVDVVRCARRRTTRRGRCTPQPQRRLNPRRRRPTRHGAGDDHRSSNAILRTSHPPVIIDPRAASSPLNEIPRGHRGHNRRNPRCGETTTINGEHHVPPHHLFCAGRIRRADRNAGVRRPECFGRPCRLPEVVEPPPPPRSCLMPETADAASAARRARRRAEARSAPRRCPRRRPLPDERRSRSRAGQCRPCNAVADDASAPRRPRRAPSSAASADAHADRAAAANAACAVSRAAGDRAAPVRRYVALARRHRRPIRPMSWATTRAPAGGDRRRGPRRGLSGSRAVYMVAPSAKIISIDSERLVLRQLERGCARRRARRAAAFDTLRLWIAPGRSSRAT